MLFLFYTACYGIWFALFQSKVAVFLNIPQTCDKIPIIKDLVKCPFCSGFWLGFFGSGIFGLAWYWPVCALYGISAGVVCMGLENINRGFETYVGKNQ